MTNDDPVAQALTVLLKKVDEVANGPASIGALYELESGIDYSHHWHDATDHFRAVIQQNGSAPTWAAEVRRPPPDMKLWLPFGYRRDSTSFGMQKAKTAWDAKGLDAFFAPHHHVPGITEGVAAMHISLLSDVDPVAAVEYAAALPNEYVIWPAAHRLEISKRPELVDQVLRSSSDQKAVMLCLACELDGARGLVWGPLSGSGEETAPVRTDAWSVTIPSRLRVLARLLLVRSDAGAVIPVWMRHLLRVAKRETKNEDRDARSRIAMTALEQLLDEIRTTGPAPQIEVSGLNDAADLVARMLVNQKKVGVSLWDEWCELVRAEHRTLDVENSVYWAAAAEVLRNEADPLEAWLKSMRTMEPLLRTRARRVERGEDPMVHMVMPAVNASALMHEHGAPLWSAIYERARRHFIVDAPADNEYGYRLCSVIFAAFPKIFGDRDSVLEACIRLLPTEKHIEWAREYLSVNKAEASSAPTEERTDR